MKIYVWEDCFRDYTAGLAVVVAPNLETAMDLLRKKIGYDHEDLAQKPKVFDTKTPQAFHVHGGG